MEKWFVAPSYKNAELISVDETNRKAHIKEKCDRCGGLGIIVARVENNQPIPIPVAGGVCYKCNGTGEIDKWVKAYTEDEYDKYMNSQARAKQKKADAEEARKQALINKSEENLRALLEKFGYESNDPKVYIVYGGNTYSIKDELKGAGARFNPALGWYFTKETQVPEGYALAAINFYELYEWFPLSKRIELKEGTKDYIQNYLFSLQPKSNSEFVGEIKERLRGLKATVTGIRSTEGYYGTTFIYSFKSGENVFVWFSSSCKDIEEGDEILLTGTVKDHKIYNGIKQTVLTRCIIKEEGV